jgi:hypothetical protein
MGARRRHLHESPPTIEQVIGRPGRTFKEWVVENADKFR